MCMSLRCLPRFRCKPGRPRPFDANSCLESAACGFLGSRGTPHKEYFMHRSVIDAIGNTPLIRLKSASEETGCEILGKAEFMNPGPIGQGPRRAVHHPRRRTARACCEPGGVIVEGTAGNTGIGLDAGRQGARLPHRHRHSRHAEPGEEGHAPAARRRADRGAGRALQEPQQLREAVGPAGRAAGAGASRTARSGPTSSTMSPTATAISARRRRRSGARPAARSTASSRRSAPAARWPASPSASRPRTRT